MSDTVIFQTNQYGCKIIRDKDGEIGRFIDSKNDIIETDEGFKKNGKILNLWYMVCDKIKDAEKIKRIRALKSSQITEVDVAPGGESVSKIKNTYVPKLDYSEEDNTGTKSIEIVRNELKRDMQRYGQLFSQICKAGGEYLKDADPKLIAEFEALKKKHDFSEETEETENEKAQ